MRAIDSLWGNLVVSAFGADKSLGRDEKERLLTEAQAEAKAQPTEPLVGRPLVRRERAGKPLDPSITEAQVSDLVDAFYAKVQKHPRLSVLFADGMSQEWPDHLDRMKGFWRSLLMQTREYDGRPVPAHMKMADLQPEDFGHWLGLFRQTALEICPPNAAALYINRAETVAKSLQMAVFLQGHIAPADAFEHGVMTTEFISLLRKE
ncbi:group III truncated hemoglobin [Cohaesibacter celericrescens]|uniref:Preprotein translocase subunit TatC n=1 Tax=Cohaesibacter celericrescens TaxID=2067669 RepID=A0A2N5XKM1_9HYPH|nr:group III truncated hemoglobin [Cohaesibacter celericrescens]PLW75015.1 hypothetical protein C0081_22200 [Cohaesibacter celericrescens]